MRSEWPQPTSRRTGPRLPPQPNACVQHVRPDVRSVTASNTSERHPPTRIHTPKTHTSINILRMLPVSSQTTKSTRLANPPPNHNHPSIHLPTPPHRFSRARVQTRTHTHTRTNSRHRFGPGPSDAAATRPLAGHGPIGSPSAVAVRSRLSAARLHEQAAPVRRRLERHFVGGQFDHGLFRYSLCATFGDGVLLVYASPPKPLA